MPEWIRTAALVLIGVVLLAGVAITLSMARYGRGRWRLGETTGHVWDGDLREGARAIPWWSLLLYLGTLLFAALYIVLYAGPGRSTGILHVNQESEHAAALAALAPQREQLLATWRDTPIDQLAASSQMMAIARPMFETQCAACHGRRGLGARGFPNLANDDWMWGGTERDVLTTIREGRTGVMPPLGAALGAEGVEQVIAYVFSLSGVKVPADYAAAGKEKFAVCAACHGADARGNTALGAPNLTDTVWLYGDGPEDLREAITHGRTGTMPAFAARFDEGEMRLLAAYVFSLGTTARNPTASRN
jgi:cytochrome c oxidase cbb3-type subunit III